MNDTLLSVQETADILRVKKRTVYNLVWAGDLPAIKVNARVIRIRQTAIEQFIADREEQPA
jgi:excisionase family DNA binding protein